MRLKRRINSGGNIGESTGVLKARPVHCQRITRVRPQFQRAEGDDGTGYELPPTADKPPQCPRPGCGKKIYRALATRHSTGSLSGYRMLHDLFSGRLTSASAGGVVVVVDGISLVGIYDLPRSVRPTKAEL